MVETSRQPVSPARAFWSWVGFWLQFLLLGLCVVIGAFAASGAEEPGDYAAGITLILGAVALAFLRLKLRFDDGEQGWANFLLVDNMAGLVAVIVVFIVTGLAGLFLAAAWPHGALHAAGIVLFVASGAIVFLDIKHVFDRMNQNQQ
jgi:hypothetical protein